MQKQEEKYAKKTKRVPGQCTIRVTPVTTEYPNRVDASLQVVLKDQSNDNQQVDPSLPIIREVQEFPVDIIMSPHWTYVNNLYIYPESVR